MVDPEDYEIGNVVYIVTADVTLSLKSMDKKETMNSLIKKALDIIEKVKKDGEDGVR